MGRLLFATDFHGQLEDFRRVVAIYERRRAAGEDLYLLFAGDFVHGPAYDRADFPEHLGDFHERSVHLLRAGQSRADQRLSDQILGRRSE